MLLYIVQSKVYKTAEVEFFTTDLHNCRYGAN